MPSAPEDWSAEQTRRATEDWYAQNPHLKELLTMPDINQMIESKYLRKEDVPAPLIVTIRAVSKEQVGKNGDGSPDFRWMMWFVELPKALRLNATIIRVVAAAFGNNTDTWLGKRVKLFVDMSVTMAGQAVGGLRIQTPQPKAVNLAGGIPAGPPQHSRPVQPAAPAATPAPATGFDEEFNDDIPF